jgi:HrpA-like RNA helicase
VQAVAELLRLEAITVKPFRLTELGKRMQHYPMIPSRSRILLESFKAGCPSEIIDILSLQEAGNPILESASQREKAEKIKTTFKHRDGDHLTYLAIFRAFIEQQDQYKAALAQDSKAASGTSPTVWCKDNALNFRVLKEAVQIRNQLRQLAQQQGQDPDISAGEDQDRVLKCLLHGLPLNTARIQPDKRGYRQLVGSRVSSPARGYKPC